MKIKTLPYILVSIALVALLIPFSLNSLRSMKLDTSIHEVLGTDQQSEETFKKFNSAFNNATTVVAVVKINNLFSNEGSQLVYDLSNAIQSIPDLQDIKSLTHSTRPVKGTMGFNLREWLKLKPFMDTKPKSPEEWAIIKEFNLAYPMTRGILVSPDGEYITIIAVLNRSVDTIERKKEVMAQARAKVKPFIEKGMTIKFLSESFISAEFHDLVQEFLFYFIILCLGLMALIIYQFFRSWRILLLMLLYQACGFLAFPFIFQLNLAGTNLFTFIVVPLASTIQLTFLTHFYSVFQDQGKSTNSLTQTLRKTLKVVLLPSFTALITSMIGMGALCLSEVKILNTVGIIGMESLLLIFIITFLPAITFSFFSKKESSLEPAENLPEHPLIPTLQKRKKAAFCAAILISSAALISFNFIKSDSRAEEFLSPHSETRQAIELIDQHFGGVAILQLDVVTEKDNGIQDYKVLQYLHNLRTSCLKLNGVQNAYTYSQFYTVVHQVITATDLSTGNQLPSAAMTFTYSQVINSFDFPFKHILQDEKRRETIFFLRTRHLPTNEYLKTIKEFEILANKDKPAGVEIKIADGIHTILESDRKIVQSQAFSAGSCLICIFICLLLIWRSLKLAIAAIICNLLPLASILLIMAFGGIPLNSITVMVSAIILGISVDDSIHFLNFFQSKLKEGNDYTSALSQTLSHKIKPMICTSLILIICLFLFLMAPFPPINQFGILGGCALAVGLFSSCIILPATLLLFYKKKEK